MKSTGNRIQARREELGLSRQFVAQKLGITRMTVWRVEAGERPLRVDELKSWAKVLKTTDAELLP